MNALSPHLVRLPGLIVDLRSRRVLRDDGTELALRQQAVGDVRRAIGDERHAVLQTVPRRGYRLIALPSETPAQAAAATAPSSEPAGSAAAAAAVATGGCEPAAVPAAPTGKTTPPPTPARARWATLTGLAAMLVAATALTAWWLPTWPRAWTGSTGSAVRAARSCWRAPSSAWSARQLDPRLCTSDLGLTFVLQYQGRLADAVAAGRRCMELAPLPPAYLHTMYGVSLWAAGRRRRRVDAGIRRSAGSTLTWPALGRETN